MDLAELGFNVDTSGLVKASKAIEKIDQKVDKLLDSVDLLGGRFGSVARDIARSIARIDFGAVNRSVTTVKSNLLSIRDVNVLIKVTEQGADAVRRGIDEIRDKSIKVSIVSDLSILRSIKTALNGLNNKNIAVNISSNIVHVNNLKSALDDLSSKSLHIAISSDKSEIAIINSSIANLSGKDITISVLSDSSPISDLKNLIDSIDGKTVSIDVDVDSSELDSLIYLIDSLEGKDVNISVVADASEIDGLVRSISGIQDRNVSVNVDTNISDVRELGRAVDDIDSRTVSISVAADSSRVRTLGSDIRSVDSEVQTATRSVKDFDKAILAVPVTIGAGIVTGLTVLTAEFLENSKELERNSERYNMSREEMQLWEQAAGGVSGKGIDIADIFQDIGDKMGDFLITGAGGAIDIFERLGMKFDDVREKSPADVLQIVINKMDELGNVSDDERTFLLEGLASEASKLQPLLENNGRLLKELMASAKENFTILDNAQLDIIKQAAKEMTAVKKAMSGVGKQAGVVGSLIVSELSVPLVSAFRSMAGWLSDTENSVQVVRVAFSVLGALAVPAVALITAGLWAAVGAGIAFALTPFGAIITALTLAAGAVVYFKDEIITMGGSTASVMDWVLATFDYVVGGIQNFGRNISTMFQIVSGGLSIFEVLADGLKFWLSVGKDVINKMIGLFVGGAKAMVMAFKSLPNAIYNIFADIYNSSVSTINNMIVAIVEPLNSVITAVGGTAIEVGSTFDKMAYKAVDSGASIKGAFTSAFNTDYIGDFADAHNISFDSIKKAASDALKPIVTDIGNIAEDRRLGRMIDEADKSFDGLGKTTKKAAREVEKYVTPVKDAKKATKELSAAEGDAKKAAESLAKAHDDLANSFQAEIVALEKEAFAIGKSKIAIYEYEQAHKSFGEENLKYSASQVKVLVEEKKRIISLAEQVEKDKEAAEAVKKHKEEIENITKSYADELETAKLDTIEIKKGVLARVEEELKIKGVGEALRVKILKVKEDTIAINASNEKVKEAREARKSLIAEIDKEREAIRLDSIEIKSGTLARFAEELKIKGIDKAIADKLVQDRAENDILKKKNKVIKETVTARDKALEAIDKHKDELKLLIIQYDHGDVAAASAKLANEGLTKSEVKQSLAITDEIKAYEKLISQREDAAKGVVDITKKYELQTFGLIYGKDAMEEAELVMKGYTAEQAAFVVETQNAIKTQKKFSDGLRTAITSATSIKDAFKNVGDFLKEWLLDQIKMYAANKIIAYVTTSMSGGSGGGIGGLIGGAVGGGSGGGGLISAGINMAMGGAGGAGGIMSTIGGLFGGGGATSGIMSSITGLFSGGMASMGAAVSGGLASIGGGIAALANPITAAILAGGFILKDMFSKGKVTAVLGNVAESTDHNDWRSGWYNSSKRAEGVDFTRESDFGQFGLLGDRKSIHLGRDDEGQIENITKTLDLMKELDDVIAGFLPESVVADVKQSLDGFESNAIDMQAVTVERLGVIFSAMPEELRKLVDVNQPIEDVVTRVAEIGFVSESLVPILSDLGVKLGDNEVAVLATAMALSDAGGGAVEFGARLQGLVASLSSSSGYAVESTSPLLDDLHSLNQAFGLSSEGSRGVKGELDSLVSSLDFSADSSRTTRDYLLELAGGFDVTTIAGAAAKAEILLLVDGIDSVPLSSSKTKDSLLLFVDSLDLSEDSALTMADQLKLMAGSLDETNDSSAMAKEQLLGLADGMMEAEKSGGTAKDSIVRLVGGLDDSSNSSAALKDKLSVLVSGFDTTTAAGETSRLKLMEMIGSYDLSADSANVSRERMVSLAAAMHSTTASSEMLAADFDAVVGGLDGSTASALAAKEQLLLFGQQIDFTGGSSLSAKEQLLSLISATDTAALSTEATKSNLLSVAGSLDLVTDSTLVARNEIIAMVANLDASTSSSFNLRERLLEMIGGLDISSDSAIKVKDDLLAFVDGLDLTHGMTVKAKEELILLTKSLGDSSAASIVTKDGLEGIINGLDLTTAASITTEEKVMELISGVGVLGTDAITTKAGLLELVKGLDLTTEAGVKAFDSAMKYYESLGLIEQIVNTVTPLVHGLNLEFGSTRGEISESIIALADMAGGVEALTGKLNAYYDNFYSQEEKKEIALANSALKVKAYSDTLDASAKSAVLSNEQFRKYVEALNLTTSKGRQAFLSAMDVSDAMAKVGDSGRGLDDILENMPSGMLEFTNAMAAADTDTQSAAGKIDGMSGSLDTLGVAANDSIFDVDNVSGAISALGGASISASSQIASAIDLIEKDAKTASDAAANATKAASDAAKATSDAAKAASDAAKAASDAAAKAASDAAKAASDAAKAASDAAAKAASDAAKALADASANDSTSDSTSDSADASAAAGISRIPRDNYLVNTHVNEAIVDAQSVIAIKRYFGADVSQKRTIGGTLPVTRKIKRDDSDIILELRSLTSEVSKMKQQQLDVAIESLEAKARGNNILTKSLELQEDRSLDARISERVAA